MGKKNGKENRGNRKWKMENGKGRGDQETRRLGKVDMGMVR
jgi:hypothetical protein